MEEGRNAFRNLTGNITGERPPRKAWEGNIIINLNNVNDMSIRGTGLIMLKIWIIREPL